MSETESQEARSGSPANFGEWLDEKLDSKGAEGGDREVSEAEPTATGSPTEDSVAESAPSTQPVNWREVVLEGVDDYGFFNGKKVPEVIESYKHAALKIDEQARQLKEAREYAERLQRERDAEAAARRVYAEQQSAQPQTPQPDEIERLWFENPARAKELLAAQMEERARNAVREELYRAQETQQVQARLHTGRSAAEHAVKVIADAYGVDESVAMGRVMGAFPHLRAYADQNNDEDVFLRPEAYINTVRWMVGDPAPRTAAPTVPTVPVPELSDPPGSKRPASGAPRTPNLSPLDSEKEATWRAIAGVFGNDPDRVVARARRRR